ncbi:14352_t:CDS:2 [Funneliformis geosporum]|nr:14352_t:CDS:2 [Funneliformis geosporum]
MKNLEEKLLEIYNKIRKDKHYTAGFHWKYAKKAVEEAKEQGEPITPQCQELAAKIAKVAIDGIEKERVGLYRGYTRPTRKNLDELEQHFQEILVHIDYAHQEFPQIFSANFTDQIKQEIKKFREEAAPLLRKFANFYERTSNLEKENFTWRKVEKIWNEVQQLAAAPQPNSFLSELVEKQKIHFCGQITYAALNFVEMINKGEEDIPPSAYPSTAQELDFLQKIADGFPALLEFAKKLGEFDKLEDKETKIQELQFTNKEKNLALPKNPTPKIFKKINEQSSEINSLKNQLNELQEKIKDLEKEKSSAPKSDPEIKQKIESLEKQKENIQQQIKQKSATKKQLENKVNQTQNNSGFPGEIKADFALSLALPLAHQTNQPAKYIAQQILELTKNNPYLQGEITPAGYINFWLTDEYYGHFLKGLIAEKSSTLFSPRQEKTVLLEYASVNPTGQLHLGHARAVAIGDTLANIYQYLGYKVIREYYINDRGQQINSLVNSNTKLEYQTAAVKEIAQLLNKQYGNNLLQLKNPKLFTILRQESLEFLLNKIKKDLADCGVIFDSWVSETELCTGDKLAQLIQELKNKNLTVEEEGALLLKTTLVGEEKNRVLIKKNGDYTYFLPDILYHLDKLARADYLINIWGADHHGYVARIKAACQLLGQNPKKIKIILVQMLSLLTSQGQSQKFSKRSGTAINLDEALKC